MIASIVEKEKSYFASLGWKSNPFRVDSMKTHIPRQDMELSKVLQMIRNGTGVIAITAPDGYGKSTFLNYLKAEVEKLYPRFIVIFLKRPLPVQETIVEIREACVNASMLSPIRNLVFPREGNDIIEKVARDGRRCIIIIDDFQEADLDLLRFIRSLADEEGFSIVISGNEKMLPSLEMMIPSLVDRVAHVTKISLLREGESRELIEKRISFVGNNNVFIDSALKKLHELSGGVPARLLDIARNSLDYVIENDLPKIDEEVVMRCCDG